MFGLVACESRDVASMSTSKLRKPPSALRAFRGWGEILLCEHHVGSGLGACSIEPLNQQHMAVLGQIGHKGQHGIRIVRVAAPTAAIVGLFARQRVQVGDPGAIL